MEPISLATLRPIPQPMTLEEFFQYDDGTDTRYELENGELQVMPTESEINCLITSFLFVYLAQLGFPSAWLRTKTELVVTGIRATVRQPDLMVLTDELVGALKGAPRSTVTLDMPPPQLVVEVVSPGKTNEDRDYRYKRSQYQARGIPEYWIIDPIRGQVTVSTLLEGLYADSVFTGNDPIASALLQPIEQGSRLRVDQLLQFPSEDSSR